MTASDETQVFDLTKIRARLDNDAADQGAYEYAAARLFDLAEEERVLDLAEPSFALTHTTDLFHGIAQEQERAAARTAKQRATFAAVVMARAANSQVDELAALFAEYGVDTGRARYAVAPGEYIQEWMDERGLQVKSAADLLRCTSTQLRQILTGEAAVTLDIARALARHIGIPVHSWLRYEDAYRADLAGLAEMATTNEGAE